MAVESASGLATSAREVTPVAHSIRKSAHPLNAAFVRTWRNPLGLLGLVILGLLVFVALAAQLISPYDPIVQHQGKELLGPNSAFWLGTDELGRDLLDRKSTRLNSSH